VAVQSDKTQVEVGLIAREGMTGLPVVLGNDRTPHSTYVQDALLRAEPTLIEGTHFEILSREIEPDFLEDRSLNKGSGVE
jgi:hypothetical protein